MAKTSAERVAAYRARQREKGEPDSSRAWSKEDRREAKRIASHTLKPFVGCDGEGAGVDDLGRQLYLLFRMGDRELFTGERLTTEQILDFICDDPAGTILVGFSFGYDVTMILRDLPERQLQRLFEPKQSGEGKSRYVWFREFDIEYLPKQYFRVRRTITTRDANGHEKRQPVKGSSRTIFETFGFFQKSFVKTLESFDVGTPEERKAIAADKARRGDFDGINQRERDYCALECRLLSQLMDDLRGYCYAAGIRPKSWNGAGKLASALHKLHKTIDSAEVKAAVPQDALNYANMAYYGGRFEITRTGMIDEKVYEHDIRSAYPAAMGSLPCLVHGRWHWRDGRDLAASKSLYVAACTFSHPDNGHGQLCGFPVRSNEGHLYWPQRGGGVYWSVEIDSARELGAKVKLKGGWEYEKTCHCETFDWVEQLYDYRRSIGSSGPGYPIKLGINALYGTLAQRVGNGKFTNMIYAGLITAMTRAKLNRAAATAPGKVVMLATDALYSTVPLDLVIGEKLGQWEYEELDGLFIVQPGLYWCPAKRKRKSRGLPGKFFETDGMTEGFENEWQTWNGDVDAIPSRAVPLTSFIGLKLALARGKPETAGCWISDVRRISFDYRNKRQGHIWQRHSIVTAPRPGSPGLVSIPHRDFLKSGGHEPWENARAMLEEQPDYVDLSPPFKD